MSRDTLCKIAGVQPTARRSHRERESPRRDSNNNKERERGHGFMSPASDSQGGSSAASTPSGVSSHSDADDSHASMSSASSMVSTPSPTEPRKRASTGHSTNMLAVSRSNHAQSVTKSSSSKKSHPVASTQVTHTIAAPVVTRRRSAAPTVTTAPYQKPQQITQQVDSDYSSAPSASSSSSDLDHSYSPWLKQDALLSPVLERSMEASSMGGGTPNQTTQQMKVHDPIRSASPNRNPPRREENTIESESAENDGRNLLHEFTIREYGICSTTRPIKYNLTFISHHCSSHTIVI